MTNKRKQKTKRTKTISRKPFWENMLEWVLGFVKKLMVPALVLWLVTWLWIGGIFAKTGDVIWNGFVNWTAAQGLVVNDVVINGRHRTNMDDLRSAIQVKPNDAILHVDVDTIQNAIQDFVWVQNVTVKRSYNGIVVVDIVERIPFVVWDRPGLGKVLVDTNGKTIKGARVSDFDKLLVVGGVDAPNHAVNLMTMLRVEKNVSDRIAGAQWVGGRRWDLFSTKGIRIMMPDNDIGFALSRLAKLQDTQNILARDLLSIDLRMPDRIIIESKKGDAKDISGASYQPKMNAI